MCFYGVDVVEFGGVEELASQQKTRRGHFLQVDRPAASVRSVATIVNMNENTILNSQISLLKQF